MRVDFRVETPAIWLATKLFVAEKCWQAYEMAKGLPICDQGVLGFRAMIKTAIKVIKIIKIEINKIIT